MGTNNDNRHTEEQKHNTERDSMEKATEPSWKALPWKALFAYMEDGNEATITSSSGYEICTLVNIGVEQTKHIINTVNSHDELLAVARNLKRYAWANNPNSMPLELRTIINQACDALESAEGA